MVKNYNSSKQLEKKREGENERITEFNNNKAGEMLEKGMAARKDVLKEAGIMQEYNFEDHQHIYNYADEWSGEQCGKGKKCVKDGTKFEILMI